MLIGLEHSNQNSVTLRSRSSSYCSSETSAERHTRWLYKYTTVCHAKKKQFVPIHPGRVHMYVCGPTVHNDSHLGHGKTYVNFDTMVRYLRYLGYQVLYVQNITDVGHMLDSGEDRMLKGSQRERVQPMQLADLYTRRYLRDMDRLNVTRPDIQPRASGHIIEMIEWIKTLAGRRCGL